MVAKKKLNRVRCLQCNAVVGHDSKIKTINSCPSCHTGKKTAKKQTAAGGFASTKKGPCLDLPKEYSKYYFRSGWEKNFARVLYFQGKKWTYERMSFTFVMNPVTHKKYIRKPFVYIPDFYDCDDDILWEIKGYLRSEDRSKIKRFKANYPDEFKKLKACVGKGNKQAIKFYTDMGIPLVYYDDLKDQYKDKVNWDS